MAEFTTRERANFVAGLAADELRFVETKRLGTLVFIPSRKDGSIEFVVYRYEGPALALDTTDKGKTKLLAQVKAEGKLAIRLWPIEEAALNEALQAEGVIEPLPIGNAALTMALRRALEHEGDRLAAPSLLRQRCPIRRGKRTRRR